MGVQPATTNRMGVVLGIQDAAMSVKFTAKQRVSVNRIAFLIVVNAMIFHEVLSKTDARVRTLHDFRASGGLLSKLIDHWQYILDRINYFPIFSSAVDLLKCLSADREVNRALEALVDAALTIVEWRASLRHDLAGRIYHRLLEEAKSLGAYYTSIPTASLLLTLTLRSRQASSKWSSIDSLKDFRIADLACGTGTLLMAAADAVVDLHIRASVENGAPLDLDRLQRTLVEKMIYGFDVLPSAIHLTASTLALRVPDTPIEKTHLYRVLHGTEEKLLGSIEFLQSHGAVGTLFSQPEQMSGHGAVVRQQIHLPTLSVCVMNPPFTSSRKGNRLFGSVGEAERRGMQTKLKNLVRAQRLPAKVTAGLGAVFVAMADRYLSPDGMLSLVLPRSVISGDAWQKTRGLFGEKYQLEYVVVCHEVGHWNFSENTDIRSSFKTLCDS
jgi:hypothetical protein